MRPVMQRESTMTASRSFSIGALLLVYVGLWLYLSPYDGLNHDAQGYALQGIAALHPDPLGQDLFLQYRSQEEFSVFSRLYGYCIEFLGLDRAAAILTFTFQLLWYGAAFLVFRALLGMNLALLGTGLLLTVPCGYGGLRVFHLAEPFLTARLPAEVLSLLALWAWLAGKRIAAGIALVAAVLIHPLIAFPALLLIALAASAARWGGRMLPALVVAGCGLAIAGSYVLGGDSPIMEGRWLVVTQLRSKFLFLDRWNTLDWNYTLQGLLTIVIGAVVLKAPKARLLMRAAAWLGLAGLALSAFYSLVAPLEVLVQGQPWRWLWPARFLAVGALPAIVLALWSSQGMRRAAAVFLAAGWLFVVPLTTRSNSVMMTSALLMTLSLGLVLVHGKVSESLSKLGLRSAWAVLCVVVLASMITVSLAWSMATSAQLAGTGLYAHIANVLRLVTPGAVVATACAVACLYHWTPARGAAVVAVGSLLVATALPGAARAWTANSYTGADRSAFEEWRSTIPRDAEVLWWESLRETWFLLERRAYLTRSQSGGVVFSESLADEIARRALVLEPLIEPGYWLGVEARTDAKPAQLTIERLSAICRDPELAFVVWDVDLGLGAPSKHWPTPEETLFLYDCRRVRPAQDDATP